MTAGATKLAGNPVRFTQNIIDDDYKGAAKEGLKALMWKEGLLGDLTRFGYGAYSLGNENGLPKTIKYLQKGEYGNAALSGAGDAFNALMTAYSFRGVNNGILQNIRDYSNLKDFINRYGYNYKPKLGLIFDDAKLDRLTNQLVRQHNSFARGVDVAEARKYWGFPESMSDAEIAEYTLTHSHKPTQSNAGGNPERKPVLYTSNSIDLGKAYTNGSGYVGIVQRPIKQGKTRSETLALNDFRFYRNPKHAFSGTTDEPFILRKGEPAPANPRNKGTWARRVKGKVRQTFKPVALIGIDALAHQGSEIVSVRRPDDVNFRHYLFLGDEGEPILNLDYMFRYDKDLPSVDYSTHSVGLSKKKELGGMLQ